MTPEDGSSDGEPSPPLPDEGRSVPDSQRGVEAAKAIEALGRALGRVSLSGQQGEARFTIEPAELTLQVAVSRTGPAGIEWLVLGLRDDEPPHASAMQMLKIRLASLPETGGHASAKVEQVLPDVAEEASATGSGEFNWDSARLDDVKLGEVLGSAAQPESVEFVRLRIYEFPAQFPQHDTAALSGRSRPVMQLVVERDSFTPPTRSKIAEAIRDKGAETMAQYIANQLDSMVSHELSSWRTEDPGGFAADADWVATFQGSLHQYLVGTPIKELASVAGIPDAFALGFLAEQIPIGFIDRYLDRAKLLIEISGIVVGATTGVPVLACASSKALAHDLFHRAVVIGIKEFIIRQRVSSGPAAPRPGRQRAPRPLRSPVEPIFPPWAEPREFDRETPTGRRRPAEPARPRQAAEPARPAETPTGRRRPAEPARPRQPPEPARPAEAARPRQPPEPVEPRQLSEQDPSEQDAPKPDTGRSGFRP